MKNPLVMKFTAIFLLVSAMLVSGIGFSQGITIYVKDAPLSRIFKEIEKQSEYNFVYTQTDLSKAKNVDIDVKGMDIEGVLSLCFKDQPLSYTIRNKIIVVK